LSSKKPVAAQQATTRLRGWPDLDVNKYSKIAIAAMTETIFTRTNKMMPTMNSELEMSIIKSPNLSPSN
jgi:hypothetical protein